MNEYGYDSGYANGYDAAMAEMQMRTSVAPVDEYDEYYEPEYVHVPRIRRPIYRPRTIYYEPEYAPETEEIAIPRHQMVYDGSGVTVGRDAKQSIGVGIVAVLLLIVLVPTINAFMAGMNATPAQQKPAVATPQPQQAQSTGQNDLTVTGQPSISVDKIAQVLAQYGSSLSAQTIYDYGVRYNIDPAFALAFFIHESGAGTQGAAVAHKNPGNLRSSPLESSHDGFAYFSDWDAGIHAWYELIASNMYVGGGLTTVSAIVEKYAPSADANDPTGYAQAVITSVNSWR